MLNHLTRRVLDRAAASVFAAVLMAASFVLVTPTSTEACFCNCYFSSDCGFLSYCKYNGCIHKIVNGKLKDGRCKFLGLFSVADLPNAGQSLDLWLQAYERAGANGGGPPNAALVAMAQSVPLSVDQHLIIRELAIDVQEAYLGLTSHPDPEPHLIGFFTPPTVEPTASCENPFALGDNGKVEPLDASLLDVGMTRRKGMVGELRKPGHGIFRSAMDRIRIEHPEFRTRSRCEFPHPAEHNHPFEFADGIDCLTKELGAALTSMLANAGDKKAQLPIRTTQDLGVGAMLILAVGGLALVRFRNHRNLAKKGRVS